MSLWEKHRNSTMCNESVFNTNLELTRRVRLIPGCVVECGTWKGGMIAAIAEILGNDRLYVLCDSFQGLPLAEEIDGPAAISWQKNDPDNCRASIDEARASMRAAGNTSYQFMVGWFNDTLQGLGRTIGPIALLRLDADWYESTRTCLWELFDHVTVGGVIIIDDYNVWDGCSRAVHDFLSKRSATERIQSLNDVYYMVKK